MKGELRKQEIRFRELFHELHVMNPSLFFQYEWTRDGECRLSIYSAEVSCVKPLKIFTDINGTEVFRQAADYLQRYIERWD